MSNKTRDVKRQARAWYRHLGQDTTWVPATGVPLPIADMDAAWRHNAANWLLRRAGDLAFLYSYGELLIMTDPIGRDTLTGELVHVEMPDDVDLGDPDADPDPMKDPEGWMRTTTLHQMLVKDLPEGIADLARHWSDCHLRTCQGTACSCWQRHRTECTVNQLRDITAPCHCNDNSPEWTL
ncbi:hypothetical protein [Nonomuraea sp. NPDC049709]|uniref:hypothetical protein n=1 Tax=Nonomuraea sp. NPDC049709 TaxID=3154736 RepID=UPI00342D256B